MTGFHFPNELNGEFFCVGTIEGNQTFYVYQLGTAAPRICTDTTPPKAPGGGAMVKVFGQVFGAYLNDADQYRELIEGSFLNVGTPAMGIAYPLFKGILAGHRETAILAADSTNTDQILSDGENDAYVLGMGRSRSFWVGATAGEMYMAFDTGTDAAVLQLGSGSMAGATLYSHSTSDKALIDAAVDRRRPVVNLRSDVCYFVRRGLEGVDTYGFDIYINDTIAKSVSPSVGAFELIDLFSFKDGFAYSYLTDGPTLNVGTLKWNGSAYVDSESSFPIDGVVDSGSRLEVAANGDAYTWLSHHYSDGVDTHYRAAIYGSDGTEVEYLDTTVSTIFPCYDAMPFAEHVTFLIAQVATTSALVFVNSGDASAQSFAAGGSDYFEPQNRDSGIAFDPGALRGSGSHAYTFALHSGTLKNHLLGSDGSNVVIEDQLPAYTSRTVLGLIGRENGACVIVETITAGPTNHVYHVDNAGTLFEYQAQETTPKLIGRSQTLRAMEISNWVPVAP